MSGPARIVLDGDLTIYRAAALRDVLLAELSRADGSLEVDLSNVVEIDSAGVQLLLAARAAARSRGHALLLDRPSEAVTDVFALFDLQAVFDHAASEHGDAVDGGAEQ